jgi:predicted HTH transcriptional regulator
MQRVIGELDVEGLSETYDLEAKRAQGRNGRGELPSSFWSTYSAMANTDGGIVLLGVEEPSKGRFKAVGLSDPGKVLKALWDGANNPEKVSANLLSNGTIKSYDVGGGRVVLSIKIPRARRD